MKALFVCFLLISASLHAQLADFKFTDFQKADSVASANVGAAVTDLPQLSYRLTHGLHTEQEKFRAIYKWVCSNIEFDYKLFMINNEKRDQYDTPEELLAWNKKLSSLVFKELIENKKTVCTGYAWLVQQLSIHAGLNCIIVDGYGRNAKINVRKGGKANHSWNAVKLNNKWYLCDPTWSSGFYDVDRAKYVANYENAYFLADPAVFIRNHYPLDPTWMLFDTNNLPESIQDYKVQTQHALTLDEFLNRPLIYSNAYRFNITGLYPDTFDFTIKKNEPLVFQFESSSDSTIYKAALSIHGPKKETCFSPELTRTANVYSVAHTFTTTGTHIVHVLLNENYICTYSVRVR